MIEFMTRLPPFGGSTAKLTVDESQFQIKTKNRIHGRRLLKIWFTVTLILTVILNLKNVLPSLTNIFSGKSIIFDNKFLFVSVISLVVFIFLNGLWKFLHSRYSLIERWHLEKLLRDFTEESDLLSNELHENKITKGVRWVYKIDVAIRIELFLGGHVTFEKGKDIPRLLQSYFVKESRKNWVLEDENVMNGKIMMNFTHEQDEKIIFDSLVTANSSRELNIRLTKKLTWTLKQPMGLIVGGTGTGKTSLLKYIIINFVASNSKNRVYTIDGKNAYLGNAMGNIGEVATSSEEAISLVRELKNLMNERYSQIIEKNDEEKDLTHEEFFHQGMVLLVADELLALVAEMQAKDKILKPSDRLFPQFYENLLSLIVKGRQASIFVIVSGQQMPATILPTEARDSLGLRIALARITQVQAQEIFNMGLKDLPSVDTEDYGGVIWLDGLGWKKPKQFISPYYDDEKLPFKATLKRLDKKKEV